MAEGKHRILIIARPYCGRNNIGWSKKNLKCTHLDSQSWWCDLVKTKKRAQNHRAGLSNSYEL